MNTVQLILIIVFTLLNILFNWYVSLRDRRFHAIFRFVGFECIFLLVILNYPVWFKDPFTWEQLTSWAFLILSLVAALIGFYTYYKRGKPEDLLEETVHIVSNGIYKYVRHPMYLSLIAGAIGVVMKDPGTVQVIIGAINIVAMYLTARIEEREMIVKFGDEYMDYMKKTAMFVPFIL